MYEKRRGVSKDAPEHDLLEATRECYQVAAEAGVTKAAVNLGVLLLTGRLQGQDQGKAAEWFRRAADEGDTSGKRTDKVNRKHPPGVCSPHLICFPT